MRAVRVRELGSFDRASIEEVEDPSPEPGEVVVEVQAVPANYVDVLTLMGTYQFKSGLPYTPGKGPAGIVREVGTGVTEVKVGDRVLAMAEHGGFAEAVAVDQQQVYQLPERMSPVEAASMSLAFDTAWMALRERARLAPGETVLVLGASGAVGSAAVQLAHAMGAGKVLAGVSSTERLASAGIASIADATVDLSGNQLRETIRDEVAAATDGAGADVIIDAVGGDAFDGAIRALAWRGRLVIVGFAAGRISSMQTNYVMLKNIEVSGLQISDYRKRMPELVSEGFGEIFSLFESGEITAPPHRTLPLDDWSEALRLIETRESDRRLILLP